LSDAAVIFCIKYLLMALMITCKFRMLLIAAVIFLVFGPRKKDVNAMAD